MSAVQEMKIYQTNLRTTIRDLGTISQKIDDLSVALKVSKVVVEGVDFAGDAAEQARKGAESEEVERSDWLETRRQQLHSRMRRRRRKGGNGGGRRSPFSLF